MSDTKEISEDEWEFIEDIKSIPSVDYGKHLKDGDDKKDDGINKDDKILKDKIIKLDEKHNINDKDEDEDKNNTKNKIKDTDEDNKNADVFTIMELGYDKKLSLFALSISKDLQSAVNVLINNEVGLREQMKNLSKGRKKKKRK